MPRGDNKHKGHKYMCSNPNCKKVFSRPKIIKYQVCPACQTLVNMAEAENQGEKPISFAPKKSVKRKKQKKVKTDNSKGLTLKKQPASVEPPLEKLPLHEKKPEGSKDAISLEQVQMPPQRKVKKSPVKQKKTLKAKTVSKSSSTCQYGFDYLDQRKKGEEIPDVCMECPKLLNCMLSDYERARVAEIKKWYAT